MLRTLRAPGGDTANPIRRRLLPATVAAVVLAWAAQASADTPPFGMAGSESHLWVYQIVTDPESGKTAATFALRRADAKTADFVGVPTESVGGAIALAAANKEALYLIFRDGTHRSLWFRDAGLIQTADVKPELPLPHNAVPRALAGDAAGGGLYALVPGSVAAELATPQTETAPAQPALTTAPAESAPPLAIVRYDGGAWQRFRAIEHDPGEIARAWVVVQQDEMTVFFVREDDTRLQSLAWTDQAWADPRAISGVSPSHVRDIVGCKGKYLIVAAATSGADGTAPVRVLALRDNGLEALDLPDVPSAIPDRLHAAAYGDRLALGFGRGEGESAELQVGLWSLTEDKHEPPTPVTAFVPPSGFRLDGNLRLAIPYLVLMALLLGALARRRTAIATPAILPANQIVAGLGRRAGAFLLDVVLVAPLMYPFMYKHLALLQAQDEASIPIEQTAMALSFELFWYWAAAAAIFVVYCTAFEVGLAATPGKLIMRCRVADENGRRCGLGRIVGRNLIRFVELFPVFQLLPSLVLILLTPKRQRLGDLIAATIVIEQLDVPADEAGPAKKTDQPDDDSSSQ